MASKTGSLDESAGITINFGEEELSTPPRPKVSHPIAVFFHLIFRITAIIAYLFCGWFCDSFIANFVIIVLLLSMDFWTVKNITGRLLVGLRWWNYVDEQGKSHWVYESRKNQQMVTDDFNSSAESRVFWLALVICPIIWVAFFFTTLLMLKFKWFMVVCIGIVLNGANLYGYIRCKVGKKQPVSSIAKDFLGQQVLKSMMSNTVTTAPSQTQTRSVRTQV